MLDATAANGSTEPEEAGPDQVGPKGAVSKGARRSTWIAVGRLALVVVSVLAALWLLKGGVLFGGNSKGDGDKVAGGVDASSATAVEVEGAAEPLQVGSAAPSFSGTDLQGSQISMDSLEEKPVWLVFNATWCSNCRAEIPDVEQTFKDRGDEVNIVAVYVSDTLGAVENYTETLGLTFPALVDADNSVAAAYGVVGLPTHVFVEAGGKVNSVVVGTLSQTQINQHLDQLVE